jgi:NodT family efflux transporter outer membrane factor (OMF) lipoprotein
LADLQAVRADFEGARLSLIGQITKAWFSAVEAREQVALAEATVESYRLTADEVERRYERGLRSPLDLRLALSNLASAEALLELRRGQLDGALRQLEILLGRYPAASLTLPDRLAPVPPPAPAGLPAQILSRRPDLVAAERRLASADRRVAEAKANLYPRLSLTGGAGTASRELQDVLNEDFSVWNLVGNLLQPVFQGGRLRAGVDLSKANMRQAWAGYAGTLLRAFSDVETALAAEGFLETREESLAEAARQADAARLLADEQYREGLIDLITLLEAQRRALTAESQLLTVHRERLGVRVDLHLALGGGFGFGGEAMGSESGVTPDREDGAS